jgi:hypothetical protein
MTLGNVKWQKRNEATGDGVRTREVRQSDTRKLKQQKLGEAAWRGVKPMKRYQTCEVVWKWHEAV